MYFHLNLVIDSIFVLGFQSNGNVKYLLDANLIPFFMNFASNLDNKLVAVISISTTILL